MGNQYTHAHNIETRFELDFIKNLGKHLEPPTKLPRATLLKGYLKGCSLRVDWRNIEKEKVIAFAESELLTSSPA